MPEEDVDRKHLHQRHLKLPYSVHYLTFPIYILKQHCPTILFLWELCCKKLFNGLVLYKTASGNKRLSPHLKGLSSHVANSDRVGQRCDLERRRNVLKLPHLILLSVETALCCLPTAQALQMESSTTRETSRTSEAHCRVLNLQHKNGFYLKPK